MRVASTPHHRPTGSSSRRAARAARRRAAWTGLVLVAGLASCAPDTTPPQPVTGLTATVVGTSVQLTWTNPPSDHTGTLVRRRAGTRAPSSVTDGAFVGDVPAPGVSVVDRALATGRSYTYAVFAHDAKPNHAPAAVRTVAVPVPDRTPPAAVTAVGSTATAESVTLTWTNPASDHTGTLVRRAVGPAPPTSPAGGTAVADVAAPGATIVDEGLLPATTYSYALFAHDAVPNHAVAATATVTTEADTTPPGPVSGLTVRTTDTSVELRWTNPPADHAGTTIRVAEGPVAPASLLEGIAVGEVPAPESLYIDTGVHHSTTYSYAVWAHDAAGNHSPAATKKVTTRPPSILSGFRELGRMAEPASVISRDGGASARLGSSQTWVFGDTLLSAASCDRQYLRTATAAVGQSADITDITEPLDACGAPAAMLAFQGDEGFTDSCHRTALWPTSVVPDGGTGTGAMFLTRSSFAECALFPTHYGGIEVTTVASEATTADRGPLLFGPDEPEFNLANVIGDHVYLYAEVQTDAFSREYRLARVPQAEVYDRSAYAFYAGTDGAGGSTWSDEVGDAAPLVLGGVEGEFNAGISGVTVSWNDHLQRYVMVHSEFLGQNLVVRTADRPEGPWSTPSYVDVVDDTAGIGFVYGGREHPSYSSGKTLALTYHSDGVRAVEVVLK